MEAKLREFIKDKFDRGYLGPRARSIFIDYLNHEEPAFG